MQKVIVSKVAKLQPAEVTTKYTNDVNLAVLLPSDGKRTFILPKVKEDDGVISLALSKLDVKELLKVLKDEDDDACVDMEILLVGRPPMPPVSPRED